MSWIIVGNSVIKANRRIVSLPVPVSAEVTSDDPDKVVITFDQLLNEASIPATTAFVLAGKTISDVDVSGANVILTVTVAYDYGDDIEVEYTQPETDKLKSLLGGSFVASFSGQVVINNILYPAILGDGNTVGFYDYLDNFTLTADGVLRVSEWRDKLGGLHTLTTPNVNNQPLLTSDGILFEGNQRGLSAGAFTFNQPAYFYLVAKQITWTAAEAFGFGNSGVYTGMLAQRTSSPNIAAYAGSYSSLNGNMPLDTFVIIRLLFNGANSKLQVDATAAVSGNFGAGAIGGLNLGQIENNMGATTSHICVKGLIARNHADSEAEETKIYNFLKSYYSI